MGGNKWLKAKMALGLKLNSCLYVPRTSDDDSTAVARFSGGGELTPTPPRDSDYRVKMPTTPTPSSSGLILPKHSSKSGKKICAICLATMKPGNGHAIFTAECSHSFHFHCITSNVKHGRQSCPVCRAQWKEIPIQSPLLTSNNKSHWVNNSGAHIPQNDPLTRIPSPRVSSSLYHNAPERGTFDDDDEVSTTSQPCGAHNTPSSSSSANTREVEVQTFPEVSAVPKSKPHDNFSILVHLKAPAAQIDGQDLQSSRAPVDLVTVLDVSGSMAGSKLALLKRAMGFVIQNLGPADRLSVIAFSSTAGRLFPLQRMTATGKHEALTAVNSLSSNGGTNIAEGLRKGAKVLTDCRWRNPIGSVILLSDGQDTYTNRTQTVGAARLDSNRSLLPVSMHRDSASGLRVPVHAFGFGADHDAVSMHLISENSGGTFSFIEAESVIQDAFAQCIGGLLSVVVQELRVEIKCVDSMVRLISIKSGSYKANLGSDKRKGSIEVGDLYAEEERDFLVTTDIPICESKDEMSLVKVRCVYKNPISKNLVTLDDSTGDVKIQRPIVIGPGTVQVSMEVDRQRNRLRSAEAMAEAKGAAERGDLASATLVLEKCRKELSETASARTGDRLCIALDAELREMQERMSSQHVYETSGRAYVLSGLSSHSWQRATARGDSTESTSLVQAYQTPSMVDMVNLSQTMVFGGPTRRPTMRPALSFPAWRTQPR